MIEVEARDQFGRAAVQRVSVRVDPFKPKFDLDWPKPGGDVVATAALRPVIAGRVQDDGELVGLRLAGEDLTFAKDGTFRHELPELAEGRHELEIEARDAAGNVTREAIAFFVDRTAPVVEWREPRAGRV